MLRPLWPKDVETGLFDRAALKIGAYPGWCAVCGRPTVFKVDDPNFRDHVVCAWCASMNRQRQVASVLLALAGKEGLLSSLRDLPKGIVVWNLEVDRALHERLQSHLGESYISSEYVDASKKSGERIAGVLHVDAHKTHFQDDSIDYILSGDVMEHVPHPEKVFMEMYRILKPGGCHIFTAPFYFDRFRSERRVAVDEAGNPTQLLPPIYHSGHYGQVIVYNIFAPELLCDLERIGYEAKLWVLHCAYRGLLGGNGIVISAQKPNRQNH